jgi:hypothetical protein
MRYGVLGAHGSTAPKAMVLAPCFIKRGLDRPVPSAMPVRSELEAANMHVHAWCALEVDVRPSRALATTTTT